MGVTLTQHYNYVDLDSNGVISSITIKYVGKVAIEMNVQVRKVKMVADKIIIFFDRDTQVKDTLFTYSGWIEIKGATSNGVNGRSMVSLRLQDSTYQRFKGKWSEINDKWVFYDDYIGMSNDKSTSLIYNYKGLKIKRTPKFRGR